MNNLVNIDEINFCITDFEAQLWYSNTTGKKFMYQY